MIITSGRLLELRELLTKLLLLLLVSTMRMLRGEENTRFRRGYEGRVKDSLWCPLARLDSSRATNSSIFARWKAPLHGRLNIPWDAVRGPLKRPMKRASGMIKLLFILKFYGEKRNLCFRATPDADNRSQKFYPRGRWAKNPRNHNANLDYVLIATSFV